MPILKLTDEDGRVTKPAWVVRSMGAEGLQRFVAETRKRKAD